MRSLRKYILTAALGIIALVYFKSSRSIDIPPASIDEITVQDREGELLRHIRDPAQIKGVVRFTASHSNGWSRPSQFFPAPASEYILRFYSDRVCQYELSIGKSDLGWNSFNRGAGRYVSKPISPSEKAELISILGALKDPRVQQKQWVANVEARLLSAQEKTAEFQKRLANLKELGPRPTEEDVKKLGRSDEEFYAFVRYARAYRESEDNLNDVRWKLKDDLFELWKLTSHGAPLLKHTRVELAEASEEICKEYRQWLEKHKDERLDGVIRNELAVNIDAVRTEYSWLALEVLQTWIHFTMPPMMIGGSGGSNYDLNFTRESREATGDAMKKWYQSNKAKLQWDAEHSRFAEDGRWVFEHPWFRLQPGSP